MFLNKRLKTLKKIGNETVRVAKIILPNLKKTNAKIIIAKKRNNRFSLLFL